MQSPEIEKEVKEEIKPEAVKSKIVPTISAHLPDGEIIELTYNPQPQSTQLAVWKSGKWELVDRYEYGKKWLVPYSASNNLIKHRVILLPSEPAGYGSVQELSEEIRQFLHRYTDISKSFETVAVSYILLTWVYERFNELPYLRFRGDPGSGKTRALLTIGSMCYKPIMANGASTVSPIFRLLDSVRGTLILDEGDFRFSDEKAEIIKILNNGNATGFPVLRSELINKHEFNPVAYHVFGPKVIATRGYFHDHALETRCLTEDMGFKQIRKDIPLNLPESFAEEAEALRNKLLLYRFRFLSGLIEQSHAASLDIYDNDLSPRMRQLILPLLQVTPPGKSQEEILDFAKNYQRELVTERSMETGAQVIEVLSEMAKTDPEKIAISELTEAFAQKFVDHYDRKITPKWMGSIVRRTLGIKAHKSHGVFIIPQRELGKLSHLAEKYGIGQAPAKDESGSKENSDSNNHPQEN